MMQESVAAPFSPARIVEPVGLVQASAGAPFSQARIAEPVGLVQASAAAPQTWSVSVEQSIAPAPAAARWKGHGEPARRASVAAAQTVREQAAPAPAATVAARDARERALFSAGLFGKKHRPGRRRGVR